MVNYLEHDNLVTELKNLEDFNPQERLEHAKKRRKQQLESYTTRGKIRESKLTQASHNKRIHFQPNICLIESSARNDDDDVREFMLNNMAPDLQNEDGLSALHQAVIEDCADVVSVLIEYGANLNIKDADLWTPLHAAVACGNYELAKYLIENGASLIEINTDGNMPIDLIEDNEDLELLLDESMVNAGYTEEKLEEIRSVIPYEMLNDLKDSLYNGVDFDITGEHGETACHIACANGYVEVLEFLLDNGARFDIGDEDNWQPIHAAACWGHDKIIEILVNHGADLEARTIDGETPYDLTEDEDMQEMLIELKQSGNNKISKVRRSQSNSSRTLSVRRSSIVEKRQTSLNDAKQEGIMRAAPELLHVDIKTDDDPHIENGSDISSESSSVFQSTEIESPNENLESLDEKQTTTENKNHIMGADLNKETLLIKPKPKDDFVVDITPLDEKITFNHGDSEMIYKETVLPPSQKHESTKIIQENQNYTVENTKDHNNIDIEIAECVPSHNTAAKNENNQKFNDSNEIKKKCCIIL